MPSVTLALLRQLRRTPWPTARTVCHRVRHDPAWVLVKATEAVPARCRASTSRPLLRVGLTLLRRRPSSAAVAVAVCFALLHGGDVEQLTAFVADRRRRAGRHERTVLARLLTEGGREVLALDLLHDVPATTGAVLEARGRARAAAGHLHDALEDLHRAAALGSGSAAVEHRRSAGLLRTLSPRWQPTPPPIPAFTPTTGRVLHLLNNSLPHVVAGYTVRTHSVALAQRRAGLDPVMVTRAGFPLLQGVFDARPRDVVDGITYHRLPADLTLQRDPAALLDVTTTLLARMVTAHRPAALQPTSPFDNARAALALRAQTDLPVVYEVRGFLEETWRARAGDDAEHTDRYRLTRRIEGWCMRQADRIVTLGEAMRADIIARGVDADRVVVIGNAVDPDVFRPRPADLALRRALGFDPADVVLGYVSSLVGYEGIAHLLAAIAVLRSRGHRARGLIVGDGRERPALEHHARRLGLADDVRFTGRVPPGDVQRHYALIDVFVVPRTRDRVARVVTPLKPLEAMALERAVVVSDVPALRELVEPGVTGLAFTPEDPTDLADTVEPLLDDPAARAALGAAARTWVASERTWRRNGERYRRLFEDLGVSTAVRGQQLSRSSGSALT